MYCTFRNVSTDEIKTDVYLIEINTFLRILAGIEFNVIVDK